MQHVTPYLDDLKKRAQQLDLKSYEDWIEQSYHELLDRSKKRFTPLAKKSQKALKKADTKWRTHAKKCKKLPRLSLTLPSIRITAPEWYKTVKKVTQNKSFLVGLALAFVVIVFFLAKSQGKEKRSRSLW